MTIKKIVIIFIIAFCLLSFMENSCLTQAVLNYGEYWNSLSDKERIIYFIGMRDGMAKGGRDCVEWFAYYLKKEEEPQLVSSNFIDECYQYDRFLSSNRDAIIKIVSDLYKDSTNSHIYVSDMCFLAYRKLNGESIEVLLGELREKECTECIR
jgi:hypothetical protein